MEDSDEEILKEFLAKLIKESRDDFLWESVEDFLN